jgi:hypothetical protein
MLLLHSIIGFKEALLKLEMDSTHSFGLRMVAEKGEEQNPYIYAVLEQADSFGATAVYFRFFFDERPPRPQVFIYAFDTIAAAQNKGAEIHHRLWNAGIVPFCFIYGVSQILVYNCSKMPQKDDSGENFITTPHDTISLLSKGQEKMAQYSARLFDSGLFWDSDQAKDFNYEQSAYEQLLIQLKNVKNIIISQAGVENAALVKRVLMMLILIKYLEERKDEHGKGALDPDEFYSGFNAESPTLACILKNIDSFFEVLDKLTTPEHFNGRVFYLSPEEKNRLRKIDLTLFRHFVEGNTSFFSSDPGTTGQMSLWRLYSFNYLPIELISHIYEDFLSDENGIKKKGVVYTPPYLVQFLVDKNMPLDKPKEHFKILDPACGSGIFLVGAFKRMIQWWRIRNNWGKPHKEHIEELKELLLSNIYGCDIEEEAVRLTYFSLSLALLDALSPKEIWRNVHFDNLMGKNLFPGDFFKTIQEGLLTCDFDLIIGNPPFESKYTDWALKVNAVEGKDNHVRPRIPDNQIALLFLEQSLKLLREGGSCCLILPSGPMLYNNKTHDFKRYLFENAYFKEICDFTPLRAKLFIGSSSSAKPAVVAITAEKRKPEGKPVYHVIFRRTRASGEKIEFEVDHYDIHPVAYQTALDSPKVWQANFMGGGRLHQLVERIAPERTLGDFLNEMESIRGWKIAEGWIEAPDSMPLKRIQSLLQIKNRTEEESKEWVDLESKYRAEWIMGQAFVKTENLTEIGIRETDVCHVQYFLRSRKKNKVIFEPPHILIKESVTGKKIPAHFSNDYLTFKDKIIGIHAPGQDRSLLEKLEEYIKRECNVPLMWLLSGQVLTSREGVPLKTDILTLPYSTSLFEFNDIEKVLLNDILNYYAEFRKEGEKSTILKAATDKDLEAFGKYYCRILNSVYRNFKPLKPIQGNEFIVYPFVLGQNPEIELPDSIEGMEISLKKLIDHRVGYNLWVRRILRFYQKNVILLYKPNQQRYWLKSVAIRDADETFMDLFNQGK